MTRIRDTWADNDSPITIELYYSSAWHDITANMGEGGVAITRGRAAWAGDADPAELTLTLDNEGGKYSPRNPSSVLYGLIGRNTPIRVKVTTNATTYTRFYGEVVAWPQKWTMKGTAYTPITAAGITRRFGRGMSPLRSAYYRGCVSPVAPLTGVMAYWPMEDAAGSSRFASGLPGAPTLRIDGAPTLSSDTSFACSDPLPVADATFAAAGTVPTYTAGTDWTTFVLVKIPTAGLAAKTRIIQVITDSLTCQVWNLSVDAGGSLYLDVLTEAGASKLTSGPIGFAVNGETLRMGITAKANGAGVDWTYSTLAVGASSGSYQSGTIATGTSGNPLWVALAPDHGLTDVVLGHVTVQNVVAGVFDHYAALRADNGEAAHTRVARLCAEEGIASTVTGTTSTRMGYQPRATFLDLLRECEATDMGALYEPRDTAGIAYRTRDSLCSQAAAVTIPYTGNLLLPFEPVEDDQLTRNRVTVVRSSGTSSTSEVTSGPLSTQAPPAGVGVYDEEITLSLAADSQVADQASWRTHVGTTDAARWPKIGIELAHPTFRASTALTAAVLGLDIGDRIVVTDPPAWLPPDDVDQLVAGYSEAITPTRYKLVLNCVPAEPYRVGVYDATDSRYSGDGTVLAEDLTTTETGVDVTAPDEVTWSHADGDFQVFVGGETMTVTGIAGTAPSYTFTVVRSVNGVVKTHLSGAAIDIAEPVYYGL